MQHRYTQEELEWLEKMFLTTQVKNKELTKLFNEKFNCEVTTKAIKHKRFHKPRRHTRHKYTEEELEWIKDKWINSTLTRKEIVELANEHFKPEIPMKWDVVRQILLRKFKIKLTDFRPNPGNYGEVSDRYKESAPIGTIFVRRDKDYKGKEFTYKVIKVDNKRCGESKNYKPLQRYIYEQAYGPLKDDEVVIFLDGNRDNFELSNLAKASVKSAAKLTTRKAWGKGKITKASIAIAEAEIAMEEKFK